MKDFPSLPQPIHSDSFIYQNRFIIDELNYEKIEMFEMHCSLFQSLTPKQVEVYGNIMTAVLSEVGGFFFLYGYGGTEKTFMWKTLSTAIRSKGLIALNVASSSIASLLLPGGKTTHSTLCIPLLINEESTCNIPQGSLRAKLLIKTKLIIWDEAPMINMLCFEALDRTLRDVMRAESEENALKPFGGKVIVLGGDFRQILPVVKNGSKYDIVKATVNYSKLWKHCKILKLTENMRLKSHTSLQSQIEIKEFIDWILHIGDGDMELNELGQGMIEIPEENLILDVEQPLL